MRAIHAAALAAVLALFGLIAAACSGPSPAPPDPAALLRQSSTAMSSVHSLSADVKFGPGLVYQGFTLATAQTQISLPSASDTTLKIKQQDFLVDLRIVTVDGHVFVKVPFGKFSEVTAQQAAQLPDLASMFDSKKGLPALLATGRSPSYLGTEKVGSTDCDKVEATYSADQVAALITGLKPAGDIRATLWIGRSDHRLYRTMLSGALFEAGKVTSVDITMHDYDAPVTVVRPTP
jgi:hypothetical protein